MCANEVREAGNYKVNKHQLLLLLLLMFIISYSAKLLTRLNY